MAEEKQRISEKQRMIVGVSGATGLVYAARALEVLRSLNVETHLIVSRAAELMCAYESSLTRKDLGQLADVAYPVTDVGAPHAGELRRLPIFARSTLAVARSKRWLTSA